MDERFIRVALGLLAVSSLVVGVWAGFFPQSFYDSFPGLGRHWVRVDGPYNEHLVRDVGTLNLGLAALAATAAWRPTVVLVRVRGGGVAPERGSPLHLPPHPSVAV